MAERELHLLLVGKTGAGTSATGNTILGRHAFQSAFSLSSVTEKSQKQSCIVANRTVSVFDSPNFFHSDLSVKDLRVEFKNAVKMCTGVHSFLILLKLAPFSEQEANIVSLFKETFGEAALRFTLIVFTHGYKVTTSTIEASIRNNKRLTDLVRECGGRYHVLNNKDPTNRSQVTELLEKIDSMVADNGNSCYTVEMFQHAQSLTAYCKRVIVSVWRAITSKSHYRCLICIIAVAVGATNAQMKESLDVLTFAHGRKTGLTAAVIGSVTRKLIVRMCKRCSFLHKSRVTLLGITCGFATGGVMGEFMGPGGILVPVLAGIAGATGAAVFTQIPH